MTHEGEIRAVAEGIYTAIGWYAGCTTCHWVSEHVRAALTDYIKQTQKEDDGGGQ